MSKCPTCGSDVPPPTTAQLAVPCPSCHGLVFVEGAPAGSRPTGSATQVVLEHPRSLWHQVGSSVAWALGGALIWLALSLPQHQINVAYSVLIGIGAGLGAGRLSRAYRSLAADLAALLVAGVIMLGVAAIVNHQYLIWSQDHVSGAPRSPRWDGLFGSFRLVFDRASGHYGWATNSSYFYWTLSLVLAVLLAHFTARRRPNLRDRDEALRPGAVPPQPRVL